MTWPTNRPRRPNEGRNGSTLVLFIVALLLGACTAWILTSFMAVFALSDGTGPDSCHRADTCRMIARR